MGDSSLVNYRDISSNKNPRKNSQYNKAGKITKITIHHMAGNLTLKACGNTFKTREISANYGIDSNGNVGLYVPENYRAWTSSSRENDYVAVTIEVANDGGAPDWHVSDKAYNKLIDLCVDICKRNGISKLTYTGDKAGNLTRHNMFTATTCPGPYLQGKFSDIANTVNKRLGGAEKTFYRVRKTWSDEESQLGAFVDLDNAKRLVDKNPGYEVYNESGVAIYPTTSKLNYKTGNYQVTCSALNVRTGPGKQYRVKSLSELTASARKQGGYRRGVVFTASKIYNYTSEAWAKTPSGYVCLQNEDGIYTRKV